MNDIKSIFIELFQVIYKHPVAMISLVTPGGLEKGPSVTRVLSSCTVIHIKKGTY